jgi:conjugative transfer pilus assembly protein TraH
MYRRKVLKVLVFFMIFLFCMSLGVEAGWLDKWYEQEVSTPPTYIKGQQRGYFTLGSFSTRIESTETLYPISISMPRLKAGCGGVDLHLGGMSFLGFDYLVQKLQNMIHAAPYVAFQIALKTISQKLGSILDTAEQIINFLNSLQLNECQFLKGFMVKFSDSGDIKAALQEGALMGLKYNSWIDLNRKSTSRGIEGVTPKQGTEGCGGNLKNLLAKLDRGKSLLEAVAEERGFTDRDKEEIGLIRAAIGDMYLVYNEDESLPVITYVEPCGEFFSNLQSKRKLKIRREWNAQCEDYDLENFYKKIGDDLNELYDQIVARSGNALDQSKVEKWGRKGPFLPVYMIVKTVAMMKERHLLAGLVEPIALWHLNLALNSLFSDAYADVQKIIKEMSNADNINGATNPDKPCLVPQIQKEYADRLAKNYYAAKRGLEEMYKIAYSQTETLMAMIDKYQQYYNAALQRVALRFGVAPASRVFGGF